MWPSPRTQYDVRSACAAENLERSAEKVFSEPDELFEIEFAEVTSKGIEENCLESESQLQDHLATYHGPSTPDTLVDDGPIKETKASFFLLDPQYSWGHLPITKSAAIKLFSAFGAFPELYQYITVFSDRTFARDEGFAGFDSNTAIGSDGTWTSFGTLTVIE
ncbi:hypothetical protein NW752_011658 [Fusarium irregulare]|uniref:CorA-like transporter domain-containing protein n=1 Tax=Fusarium irregulare TaxID=2494466 RepID=A0A9W8PE50_9HYPO|nr:hypothetical protein NW766_012486 [Fusarium irregulare]KAJ4004561.1 hypothetical protein NW752_011658 [Fusarium irregulare]